jgi:hypothetical protein
LHELEAQRRDLEATINELRAVELSAQDDLRLLNLDPEAEFQAFMADHS